MSTSTTRRWSWRGQGGFLVQFVLTALVPLGLLAVAFAVVASSLHQRAMQDLVGQRDLRTIRLLAHLWEEQWSLRARMVEHMAQSWQGTPSARPPWWKAWPVDMLDAGLVWMPTADRALRWTPQGWQPTRALTLSERDRQRGWLLVQTDEPQIWLLQPLPDGGLLLGGFSLAALGSPAALALDEPASLRLAQPSGTPLLEYVGPWPGQVPALQGEEGIRVLRQQGQDLIVAYRRLRPTGWYLLLAEPWDAASGWWLRATEWIPLTLAPVLLLSLALLWFSIRRVVQPLLALEAQARAVAWGQADALAEPVGGVAEIRRLQRTLHHMAQKIHRAQQSLRSYLAALTAGQEEERRRLARELHDETLQTLIALQQRLQLAAQDLADQPQVQPRLHELQQLVHQAVQDLRRLLRDLRPLYLEELGLIPALEALAREVSRQGTNLQVEVSIHGPPRRLAPDVELALYRIAQEALHNVVRHARATQARVVLAFEPDQVRLEVHDNGQGFVAPASPADFAPQGHYGLLGMQERAERLGASFRVHTAPGQGTLIAVRVPEAAAAQNAPSPAAEEAAKN